MEKTIINNPGINYLKVIDFFGIKKGDTLFISSDVKQLFFNEAISTGEVPDANAFIDALIEKVGPEGTLLFPTYNWDFCKGVTFDWKKTKGKTGSLGNVCLKRTDFKRTKHPIYSCVVWGKDKDYLCSNDYVSSFGKDSIFAYLDEKHARQVVIDVSLTHSFTYIHYIEEMASPIEYRYMKNFTSKYIDSEGSETTRTYSMLVRDLDLDVQTIFEPIEEDFVRNGLEHAYEINSINYYVIDDLHSLIVPVLDDIKNNKSRKICKYIGQ